jgi:hypothetical protein
MAGTAKIVGVLERCVGIPMRGAVLIMAVVITSGASLGFGVSSNAWAEQTSAQGSAVTVSGNVTANSGTSLQIDHTKTYPLYPHVTLKDGEGNGLELEAKDIAPGFNVKVHVTEGHIDHIVVIFPK